MDINRASKTSNRAMNIDDQLKDQGDASDHEDEDEQHVASDAEQDFNERFHSDEHDL
jgi:hypothetical protein